MATFKAVVKTLRSDGYYKVYIRVTHRKEVGFFPTTLLVSQTKVKGREIIHNSVLRETAVLIKGYIEKLNNESIETWSVQDIIEFLKGKNKDISFSDWCRTFYNNMYNEGRDGTAKNYKYAICRLEEFSGKKNLLFSDVTSKLINEWISFMKHTNRAKNMYPKAIKTMFTAGCNEYNDYDRNILKITHQPFHAVKIPRAETPEQRSISLKTIQTFFQTNLSSLAPPKGGWIPRAEKARDVCMIIFCLAGINTADLFDLKKENLDKDWKLCYNRKKTRGRRENKAYMEITVPELIRPLFLKYAARKGNALFCFSELYSCELNFNKAINLGIDDICKLAKIENNISTYSFRHSWATLACNDCGADMEEVGFALVHAS
ncbi:MAG: site-specific integrase, partial [Parabacteroides sp.]|nr:site-specific integrase [Parabacteroides sp.]